MKEEKKRGESAQTHFTDDVISESNAANEGTYGEERKKKGGRGI